MMSYFALIALFSREQLVLPVGIFGTRRKAPERRDQTELLHRRNSPTLPLPHARHLPSSALWFLPGADGADERPRRHVQGHGGANERFQRLFIDLVALVEIDGAPGVAFEAGVEEAGRVIQCGALGEGHLHDIL